MKASISRRAMSMPPKEYGNPKCYRLELMLTSTASHSACMAAMKILRHGGTAVDAIENAIVLLEDREVTNAGYGSNLSMDGIVECDASIVDHLGRSGGVGAVAR